MADLSTPNPGGPALTDDAGQGDGITNTTAGPGEDNALICARTGFRVSVSTGLRREWTGRYVRPQSWEARHPLDFLRPNTRERGGGSPSPEGADVFIEDTLLQTLQLDNNEYVTLDDGSLIEVYA
jgi:hypothetical protein